MNATEFAKKVLSANEAYMATFSDEDSDEYQAARAAFFRLKAAYILTYPRVDRKSAELEIGCCPFSPIKN